MATEFISNSWLMPTNANAEANRVSNYSLDFDSASNQSINCGNISALTSSSNFSISGWFTQTTLDQYTMLFGQSGGVSSIVGAYTFTDGNMYVDLRNGSSTYGYFDYSTVISADTWFHLAMVFDGSGASNSDRLKLYINNSEMTLTYNGTIPTSTSSSVLDFNIGIIAGYSKYWLGKITEISIFDYSLTDGTGGTTNQIGELYGTGSAIGNPMAITNGRKPVAYYPLGNSAFNGEFLVPNGAEKDFVFNFDGGINNGININNNLSLQPSTSFTLSCWIKSETSQNFYAYPVYKESLDSSHVAYGFYLQGSSTIATTVTTSGVITSDNIGDLRDGKWHHVVQTYDGSGMKVYLDGVQSGTTKSITGNVVYSATSTELYIGNTRRTSPSGYFSFKGNISNVSVFNTALPATGTESVESLYNYGTPPNISSYSNLQGWWELDASATFDGSNWSIPDASSNSNTGTSSGMTAANLVQSDLTINAPFDSFSLSFDGVDERISFTETDLGLNNSISIWFKRPSTGANVLLGQGSAWYDYAVRIESNGSIKYADRYTSPTLTFDNASTKLIVNNTNTWVNIVIVRTGSTANLYVNGVDYDGSKSWGSGSEEGTVFNRLATAGDGSSFGFNGQLSNFASWNTSLTSAQALEVYNEAKPSNLNNHSASSSLVSWYRLGAVNTFYNSTTTEFTVLDEVGTNDGTSVNMEQGDLVDGVGATGSGTSSGMSSGTNRTGDAPYSENNAVSYNLSVLAKSTSTPT